MMKRKTVLEKLHEEADKAHKFLKVRGFDDTDYYEGRRDALHYAIALLEGKHGD